jgi:hypothetical protein
LRLLLLVFFAGVGCDRQNFVQLVAVETGDNPAPGSGGPAGFSCRLPCAQPDGTACAPLLFQRAADAARPSPLGVGLDSDLAGPVAMGSAVVDFLTLAQGPSDSDPFVVIARCANAACTPIRRQCFPLDLTSLRDTVDQDGANARGKPLDAVFDELHQSGAIVSADAPDQELLVRMVTTTLTCDQIAARPLRFSDWSADDPATPWGESIFGCGYAGPLRLDAEHGAVFLGLPTLDPVSCVPEAAVCAADFDPTKSGALLGP